MEERNPTNYSSLLPPTPQRMTNFNPKRHRSKVGFFTPANQVVDLKKKEYKNKSLIKISIENNLNVICDDNGNDDKKAFHNEFLPLGVLRKSTKRDFLSFATKNIPAEDDEIDDFFSLISIRHSEEKCSNLPLLPSLFITSNKVPNRRFQLPMKRTSKEYVKSNLEKFNLKV